MCRRMIVQRNRRSYISLNQVVYFLRLHELSELNVEGIGLFLPEGAEY